MPANNTLHLGLTKSQMDWISRASEDTKKSKSRFVQDIIDASMKSEVLEQKIETMIKKTSDLENYLRVSVAQISPQLEIILAYVKEIFRESSANLYRLNAVIDEFSESEKVRSEVNEYVRKQEATMRAKSIQIQETNL
jgi:transcriptional regulator NrdR family protein